MVARYLYMDAATWDRQPFWAQRIYMEGLSIERPWDHKPSPDSNSWWSPFGDSWESFGELDINEVKPPEYKNESNREVEVEDTLRVKLSGLPDVTSYGMPVTKIRLPKETGTDN